jgi:succinate dehydrogenase/fumarate reductase flavoprotein subunit
MSRDAGVVRDAPGLDQARHELEAIAVVVGAGTRSESSLNDGEVRRAFWELRNLVDAARAVVAAAAHREESRGAHYRADFPGLNPALDGQHTLLQGDGLPRFGVLDEAFADATV